MVCLSIKLCRVTSFCGSCPCVYTFQCCFLVGHHRKTPCHIYVILYQCNCHNTHFFMKYIFWISRLWIEKFVWFYFNFLHDVFHLLEIINLYGLIFLKNPFPFGVGVCSFTRLGFITKKSLWLHEPMKSYLLFFRFDSSNCGVGHIKTSSPLAQSSLVVFLAQVKKKLIVIHLQF
jgi:hypothetical protein